MYWKIGLVVAGFFVGWLVNGWRLQLKLVELENQYSKNLIIAHEQTRKAEETLIIKAEQIERVKNNEINSINSKLRSALIELQQRPSRQSTDQATSDCQGASGRDLSRQDAEFLTREAARADRIRQALSSCYSHYDSVQKRSPQ
jgi:hypothetical protein